MKERKEAIEAVRQYVEEEVFGPEAYMTSHRSGLKRTYQEAARQEYSILGDSLAIKKNEAGIAKCLEVEKACRKLCEEIEGTVSRLGETAVIAAEARSKAKSVAEACDTSNAAHRQYVLDAERYESLLVDVEALNSPEIGDADDVEASLKEIVLKIERIRQRMSTSSSQVGRETLIDLEEYLAEVRSQGVAVLESCRDLCCEAIVRYAVRDDEEGLSEVRRLFGLLRSYPEDDAAEAAAAEVQRQYCQMRSENQVLPLALELCSRQIDMSTSIEESLVSCCQLVSTQVCEPERTMHQRLFAVSSLDDRDAAFVDAMLFECCEAAIHESLGRPLVLKISQLDHLKSFVLALPTTALDDAVLHALLNVARDARERAIFIASTFVRDNIEQCKAELIKPERPGCLAPPVEAALCVLGQLQDLAEAPARNHFAQHALSAASAVVVKYSTDDLWLISQLLALREALPPPQASQSTGSPQSTAAVQRRSLNWTAARGALAEFNAKHQSVIKRKQNHSFSRFASLRKKLGAFVQSGLPHIRVLETTIDARRTIDAELATATKRFVHNVHLALLSPVVEFQNQLKAECPAGLEDLRDASPAQLAALKGAPFTQPQHLSDLLASCLTQTQTALIDLQSKLAAYISKPATRNLLLKPGKQRALKSLTDFKAAASALLASDLYSHLRTSIDQLNSLLLDD